MRAEPKRHLVSVDEARSFPQLTVALPPAMIEEVAHYVLELLDERDGDDCWLNAESASKYLDCPISRIYELCRRGVMPHEKDGSRLLLRRSELDAWVRGGGGKRLGK